MTKPGPVLRSRAVSGAVSAENSVSLKGRATDSAVGTLVDEVHRIGEYAIALPVLLGMLAVAYCLANPFLFQRLVKIEGMASKGFFLVVHAVAILSLLAAVWSAKKIFYSVAVISFLSILLDNCFFLVKHYPITLSDLAVLLASHGNMSDAVSQFYQDFSRALATACLLMVCLGLLRWMARPQRHAGAVAVTLTTLSFCLYVIIAIFKGEPSLVGLPSSNSLLFGAVVISLDNEIHSFKASAPVMARRSDLPIAAGPKHIVLVIDESVEAEAFRKLSTEPFENGTDLGSALSGANCSAASNYILRVGPDDLALAKTLRATPTLFQLAKESGFTTEYFDLQGVLQDTAVHNYISSEELGAVDQVHRSGEFGAKNYERDMAFAKRFSELISQGEKGFAIVNKTGSHFPYASNLPPELAHSQDAYGASVTRSTVDFLHAIDATLPESTVVFYTSDHGQNFLSKSPHCNGASDSTFGEWRVPLIVFTSKDLSAIRANIKASWAGQASHFEVSETIRVLLGYEAMFSKTLFEAPGEISAKPYRAYFGPIKGLLGRPPSYREFDREKLGSTRGASL